MSCKGQKWPSGVRAGQRRLDAAVVVQARRPIADGQTGQADRRERETAATVIGRSAVKT